MGNVIHGRLVEGYSLIFLALWRFIVVGGSEEGDRGGVAGGVVRPWPMRGGYFRERWQRVVVGKTEILLRTALRETAELALHLNRWNRYIIHPTQTHQIHITSAKRMPTETIFSWLDMKKIKAESWLLDWIIMIGQNKKKWGRGSKGLSKHIFNILFGTMLQNGPTLCLFYKK